MNPAFIFLLLFVGTPTLELYFMIQVGSEIGAFSTVVLVLFTAALGGTLVRMQGFSTALRVREAMARGEIPAVEMLGGALLLVCGVLLLLPGFVTDVIGFICLVPAFRHALVVWFLKRANIMRHAPPNQAGPPSDQRVIDGESRREDDSK
ncbi:FxsA protein [hydrothermal vent metagenome]|uniref:FxsA protein n=1 Tax=hydrothermal vent metagenome TaxID=652676 RepID=A0A3B1B2J0_9ZZZZ